MFNLYIEKLSTLEECKYNKISWNCVRSDFCSEHTFHVGHISPQCIHAPSVTSLEVLSLS